MHYIGEQVLKDGRNKIILYAEETEIDAEKNISSIHTRLVLQVASQGYVRGSGFRASCSGGSVDLGYRDYREGTHILCDGWFTANHNNDGSGSAVINGNLTTAFGSWSTSGILYLTNIPRYFTSQPNIKIESSDTTELKINWSTSEARNYTSFIINGVEKGSATYEEYVSGDGRSGWFKIKELEPNTNYSVYCKFRRTDSGLFSNSNTININTSNKVANLYINGWKKAEPYIYINGWKKASIHVKNGERWEMVK